MSLKKKQSEALLQWNRGDENVIPARFLALLNGKTVVKNGVPVDVTPETLSITTVSSRLKQVRTDERELSTTTIDYPVGKTYTDYKYDEDSGVMIPVVSEIVATPTGESIPVGINSDGTYSEFQGLTPAIGLRTTQLASGLTTRTYTVAEHVTLPRVLTIFQVVVFSDKGYPYRNPFNLLPPDDPDFQPAPFIDPGTNIVQVAPWFELTDYSGEYVLSVTETWRKEKYTDLAPTNFQPRGFSWVSPFGSGSVPPCLHGAISISYTTGTTHPKFDYIEGNFEFAATTPADLSGTLVIEDSQHPYRGGFRRIKKTMTI